MKIYKDIELKNFEFWGPAKEKVSYITEDELDRLTFLFEDVYPDGMSATTLNDMFAYDDDFIADILGYESFEELMEREV